MYKEEVKVWNEDLLEPKAVNAASVTGDSILVVNATMGAITANVFAVDDVNLASAITVTIKDSDTGEGSFNEVAKGTIAIGKYSAGDLMGTVAIPFNVKRYAKAEIASATGNSGTVRVTGGFLPR